jgi:hypothetical protein
LSTTTSSQLTFFSVLEDIGGAEAALLSKTGPLLGPPRSTHASPSGSNRIGESNEEASSGLSSSSLTDVSSEIFR